MTQTLFDNSFLVGLLVPFLLLFVSCSFSLTHCLLLCLASKSESFLSEMLHSVSCSFSFLPLLVEFRISECGVFFDKEKTPKAQQTDGGMPTKRGGRKELGVK